MSQNAGKKKLLFVITKGTWGGAQKYVFDLAHAFQSTYDVVVIHGTSGRLVEALQAARIRTIHIASLGRDINPLLDIQTLFELRDIFRNEKADIIHLNSSKIGGLGALAGRLAGIKNIIFTAHGWAFNEDRNPISKAIIWVLSWLTALFAHSIIVLSSREQRQAEHMPFISRKVHLIKNGITPQEFLTQQEARHYLSTYSPTAIPGDKKWIGTISELHSNKGLLFALEAVHSLVEENYDIQFVIIGEGEQRKLLEEKIISLHLENNVRLLGSVDNAALYLKAFDIFLLSSVKEGLPYVLLEAATAKLPVVATHVGGIPELTNNGQAARLVHPKNSIEIYLALKDLLDNSDVAQNLAHSLNRYVQNTYNVDNMQSSTRKLYGDSV
jgi:glycosyltransferase involved in cell wall biosynthesis